MPQTAALPTVPTCLARPRLGRLAVLVGLTLTLSMVPRVRAATTWTVCADGCDYSRIKAAIAAPTTLDGDTLMIGTGVYTEAGIVVDKNLTLQGEKAVTTIVQAADTQGMASDRVFTIASGVSVNLQNLTIQYGRMTGNGSGLYNAGTLTLTHCIVHGNKAIGAFAGNGGGLYNAGTLTLTHSTVHGNKAAFGSGLYNVGTLTLIRSTVHGNKATVFGGGLINLGTLTLTYSTISSNTATSIGGGLSNSGTLTLTHSTISDNAAGSGGGLFNVGT